MIKTCVICGKAFETNFSRYKCCSPDCSKKLCTQRNHERDRKKSQQKFCVICGKPFTTHSANKITCSPECARTRFNRKREYKRKNKIFSVERPRTMTNRDAKPRHCINCGQKFKPTFKGEKFCSDDCRLDFFHFPKEGLH